MDRKFAMAKWRDWGISNEAPRNYMDATEVLIAIEIELESDSLGHHDARHILEQYPSPGWRVVSEGSLRNNGLELISARPVPLPMLHAQLAQLVPILSTIVPTFRAALHTHVNVQNLTRLEYIRLACFYWYGEKDFYNLVGKGRDESVFCIPWYEASDHLQSLLEAYVQEDPVLWNMAIAESPKYSGLNLGATRKFGSVEFRHMQTPAYSPSSTLIEISRYVGKCYDLVNNSLLSPSYLKKVDDEVFKIENVIRGCESSYFPPPSPSLTCDLLAMSTPNSRGAVLESVQDYVHVRPNRRTSFRASSFLQEMADMPVDLEELRATVEEQLVNWTTTGSTATITRPRRRLLSDEELIATLSGSQQEEV